MICLDEIRGRLAEVFSLKSYKIDHVLHGSIASAAVYGALAGATAEEIESGIGMTVAHYIPYRAIRAGHAQGNERYPGPKGHLPQPGVCLPILRANCWRHEEQGQHRYRSEQQGEVGPRAGALQLGALSLGVGLRCLP